LANWRRGQSGAASGVELTNRDKEISTPFLLIGQLHATLSHG